MWIKKKEIEQLSEFVKGYSSGEELDIRVNKEGSFNILKNDIYALVNTKNEQIKAVETERDSLSDYMADISHQLKTPLTSMMVMTELLEREKEETKRKQFVETLDKQLEKMKWLITYLLRLSKLDAGTVVFHTDEIALEEVWKASIEPYLLTMDLRNISVEKGKLEGTIRGDFNWTCEAVGNIVKNCMEHMDDGGHLYVETKDYSLYQSLILRDDGCGIEKDELPHIFERFYRVDKARSRETGGNGLGLAITRSAILLHRGSIKVHSVEKQGTTFNVRIPLIYIE